MTKKFIAQTGSNNSVKIFDAQTGTLYRVINVGGEIVSQPLVVESDMVVSVKTAGKTMIKQYTLPGGGLKKTTPI